MSFGGQSGSQNQNGGYSGNTSSASVVDPTKPWLNTTDNLAGNLGSSGLNPDQQGSLDWMKSWAGSNPFQTSAGVVNNMLMPLAGKPAYQSAGASPVMSSDIASMISRFQNPEIQGVVDATTNDAKNALDVNLNDIQGQYGGQYGNGRSGVAMGQAVGDATRGLATTIGNLRSGAYKDALTGATNQGAQDLTASGQTAANTLNNNQFNVGQQNAADARQSSILQQILGNVGQTQQEGTEANQDVYNAAGGGNSNLMAFLNSQVPAFGQTNTGTASGTSNSSGGSSQKGGGVKLF